MDKPGLVDWLLAPLNWLERSIGWKRRGLVLLYLLIASSVALFGWRELSLWRLPDIGEPFDTTTLGTLEIPDDANAMVLYRQAAAKLIKPSVAEYKVSTAKAWDNHDWANADPEVRRWVEENHSAFEIWLQGTERPDSLYLQPRDLARDTVFEAVFSLRDFARLAMLEASKLEPTGDVEGVWRLYRAVLRSSRHAGSHGGVNQRQVGQTILKLCQSSILAWIEDPRVSPKMLHRAIADVEVCRSMTPAYSEMVRAEYFLERSVFNHPEQWRRHGLEGPEGDGRWYNHIPMVPIARQFYLHEPERSLRVLSLITAGRLAQCDQPRLLRPSFASPKYMIYEINERTPRTVAAIAPEELATWADRSAYSMLAVDRGWWMAQIELESTTFDTILLQMAQRAYEAEVGKPARKYGELLGAYLKALPDGIESEDLTGAAPGPN